MLEKLKRWALKEIANKIFDEVGECSDYSKLSKEEYTAYIIEADRIFKNEVFQNELKNVMQVAGRSIMTEIKTDTEFQVHRGGMIYIKKLNDRLKYLSGVRKTLK